VILSYKTNLKHINKAHVVQLGAPKKSADQLGAAASGVRVNWVRLQVGCGCKWVAAQLGAAASGATAANEVRLQVGCGSTGCGYKWGAATTGCGGQEGCGYNCVRATTGYYTVYLKDAVAFFCGAEKICL
jgi:hypothetical protein